MHASREYITSLKEARAYENERQAARQQRRADYLMTTRRSRLERNAHALHADAHRHRETPSAVEVGVYDTICDAMSWWDGLCDNAVEQRLAFEAAEQRKVHNQKDYLRKAAEREHGEFSKRVSEDERQWREVMAHCESEEESIKKEVVSNAITVILKSVHKHIEFLNQLGTDGRRSSRLAQVALNSTTRDTTGGAHDDTVRSTNHIFEAIFGKNSFQLSSSLFQRLLKLMLDLSHRDPTRQWQFDVNRTPVVIVCGSKLSGKTCLAHHLATAFGMKYISGDLLVHKALKHLARARNTSPAMPPSDVSCGGQGTGATVAASVDCSTCLEGTTEEKRRACTSVAQPLPPSANTSCWVEMGADIERILFHGGSLSCSLLIRLFQAELRETSDDCCGVVLDASLLVITNGADYAGVREAFLHPTANTFAEDVSAWCGERLSSTAALCTPPQTPVAADSGSDACALPQTRAGAVDSALTIKKSELADPALKKDARGKPGRKNANAPTLPPPVLPPVEDITAQVEQEEAFIAQACAQLAAHASLFSATIFVQCSPYEAFKRYDGLRVDAQTGEEYHMMYRPPPEDRVPYLTTSDRTVASATQLYWTVCRQQRDWKTLVRWLRSAPAAVQKKIIALSGEQPLEQVQAEADRIMRTALDQYHRGKQLYQELHAAQERVAALTSNQVAQVAARAAERERLVALYAEKGAQLPPELDASELEKEMICTVPDDLPAALLGAVATLTQTYRCNYHWAWSEIRGLVNHLVEHRDLLRGQLRSFYRGADDKQGLLNHFADALNAVPAALRSTVSCKEELHLYADELSEALFSRVDQKHRDSMALLSAVTRRESYFAGWETSVRGYAVSMVQMEAHRFTVVANATQLYFCSLVEEPLRFEELEVELSATHSAGHVSNTVLGETPATARSARERRMQGGKKGGHARPPEEINERSVSDALADATQRLTAAMTVFVDKVKAVAEPNGRSQYKGPAPTSKMVLIASKCVPLLEEELACAKDRLGRLRDFVDGVVREGEVFLQQADRDLHAEVLDVLKRQAAAVNSALYVLRNAIETEQPAPTMHLGCGTFAVLEEFSQNASYAALRQQSERAPSFLTDVPLEAPRQSSAPRKAAVLTGARLEALVSSFLALSPNYQLSREHFFLLVREEDYTGARLTDNAPALRSPANLFACFDRQGCGFVDWRELVVHLLFWCGPPVMCTASGAASERAPCARRDISVDHLLDVKQQLDRAAPTTLEAFSALSFFFDSYLESAEQRAMYVRMLWKTFYDAPRGVLNSEALLGFLCADAQPARGTQKAFYVLPAEEGVVTLPQMDAMFHIKATNPRAMGAVDPFSWSNLMLLFEEARVVTFEDVCACVIGRKMLNNVDCFQRKSFLSSSH